MTDIDYDFDDNQTFGDKKKEIKRLFKQLPLDLRNEVLKELEIEQEGLPKSSEPYIYLPNELF